MEFSSDWPVITKNIKMSPTGKVCEFLHLSDGAIYLLKEMGERQNIVNI